MTNGQDNEVSMADIKKELFDTENVILKGDKDKKDGDKLDNVD